MSQGLEEQPGGEVMVLVVVWLGMLEMISDLGMRRAVLWTGTIMV